MFTKEELERLHTLLAPYQKRRVLKEHISHYSSKNSSHITALNRNGWLDGPNTVFLLEKQSSEGRSVPVYNLQFGGRRVIEETVNFSEIITTLAARLSETYPAPVHLAYNR